MGPNMSLQLGGTIRMEEPGGEKIHFKGEERGPHRPVLPRGGKSYSTVLTSNKRKNRGTNFFSDSKKDKDELARGGKGRWRQDDIIVA